MYGDIIHSRLKVTEKTTLAKLSFTDQIKLLINKFNNDAVTELDAAEKLSATALRMRSSLTKLFSKATSVIDDGKYDSATIQVSSKYLPYLNDVINEVTGMGRYYTFEVFNTNLPANIDYMFIVRIKRKVS